MAGLILYFGTNYDSVLHSEIMQYHACINFRVLHSEIMQLYQRHNHGARRPRKMFSAKILYTNPVKRDFFTHNTEDHEHRHKQLSHVELEER